VFEHGGPAASDRDSPRLPSAIAKLEALGKRVTLEDAA
jgi:hypothetical protein